MNKSKKVTIYIPTKNRDILLRRAIESILTQSYENIEAIIVDDGSSDGTKAVLEDFEKNEKIKIFKNSNSVGACAARNIAIQAASGFFVTGLDDDDYFNTKTRIETFVKRWEKESNNNQAFFDSAIAITQKGSFLRHTRPQATLADLRKENVIGNQVFATKDTYLKAGLFDPTMPAWQDWDLWIRMARSGVTFHNINLSSYTIDESHNNDRITTRGQEKIRDAKEKIEKKLSPLTDQERASITLSMLAYPNAKPNASDFLALLKAQYWRKCAKLTTQLINNKIN